MTAGTACSPLPTARRVTRLAVAIWVGLAVIVWNGLYDLQISLGIRAYLAEAALHEAGRGPAVSMSDTMRETVREAVRVATFWASLVLFAGLWTIRLLRSAALREGL